MSHQSPPARVSMDAPTTHSKKSAQKHMKEKEYNDMEAGYQ